MISNSSRLYLCISLLFLLLFNGCFRVDPEDPKIKDWSKAHRARRAGVKPPPPGYEYRYMNGKLWLDNEGNPILFKEDSFTISMRLGIGYAPTFEQHQSISLLEARRYEENVQGNIKMVKQLDIEIAYLKYQARGELPDIQMANIIVGRPSKVWWEEYYKVYNQAREKAYETFDLQHLIPPQQPKKPHIRKP